jgi:hypothetical protein
MSENGGMVAASYLTRILREAGHNTSYFAFSGDRPPAATFKSLGLEPILLARQL